MRKYEDEAKEFISDFAKGCYIEDISLFHKCYSCGIAVYEFKLSCGHSVDYNYAIGDKVKSDDILGDYCKYCGKMIIGTK